MRCIRDYTQVEDAHNVGQLPINQSINQSMCLIRKVELSWNSSWTNFYRIAEYVRCWFISTCSKHIFCTAICCLSDYPARSWPTDCRGTGLLNKSNQRELDGSAHKVVKLWGRCRIFYIGRDSTSGRLYNVPTVSFISEKPGNRYSAVWLHRVSITYVPFWPESGRIQNMCNDSW